MQKHIFFAIFVAAGGAYATMSTAVTLDLPEAPELIEPAVLDLPFPGLDDALQAMTDPAAGDGTGLALDAPLALRMNFRNMAARTIRQMALSHPGASVVPITPVGYNELVRIVEHPAFRAGGGRFTRLAGPGFCAIVVEQPGFGERDVSAARSGLQGAILPQDIDALARELEIRANSLIA